MSSAKITPLPFPYLTSMPDAEGYFGPFGGSFIPPALQEQMDLITKSYMEIRDSKAFQTELSEIRTHYQGRPTPLQLASRLSPAPNVQIYLKREDLNHSGAHKLNHCMAEVLLAKHLGKKKVIAETGAGQHGVALATAAAYFGLQCEIHMGAVDVVKEAPNVARMKVLGAKLVIVQHGLKTLKEAVDSAFEAYIREAETSMYCIGSVVGPHPFPFMVREFQKVIGEETMAQFEAQAGGLPDAVIACVGGGSNAIGIFAPFVDHRNVELHAVEPLGTSSKLGDHAASLTNGEPGTMHGFASIMLKDSNEEPAPVHSVASGLDYPSVGPEHAYLYSVGRTKRGCGATDDEAINAFFELSRKEGIIPALETSHAIAWAIKEAQRAVDEGRSWRCVVNVSGRGDKDMDFVLREYGHLLPEQSC